MANTNSTTSGCAPVSLAQQGPVMLNPLIHKSPGDTLYYAYCILDFIDMLPNHNDNSAVLSLEEAFGYFSILQCVKGALKYEYYRNSISSSHYNGQNIDTQEIIQQIESIKHSNIKNSLLSEIKKAIDLCT